MHALNKYSQLIRNDEGMSTIEYAMGSLAAAALAGVLYVWCTLKQYWLAKNNREAYTFSWDMIADSFSTKKLTTAVEGRNFRNEIKKAIHDILCVWPNAGITADTDGVTLTKTATSVRQQPPRPELD